MRKQLTRFATAAALAAGMALAQAPAATPAPQTGQQNAGVRPRAGMRHRLMTALNLTDAQKQQARSIFQQARQQAQPLVSQMKQNRADLTAAVKANDASRIQALASQQGNLRGQLLTIRSEAQAKFYNTLTPDQRAKADQIHANMQQRFQQRMQHRQEGTKANNG